MRNLRFIIVMVIIAFIYVGAGAQNSKLKYNKDGKFRIVQFTDLHNIYGRAESKVAIECINNVLDIEKPDLVIFTGDLIYGAPAKEGLKEVLQQVINHKTPYAVVWGNHDDESGRDRAYLQSLVEIMPYNVGHNESGVSGSSNFVLEVYNDDKIESLLYCFDSHSYSKVEEVKGYDWIKHDQIAWYIDRSLGYRAGNGDKPLMALAFFHIPLPEFQYAATSQDIALVGTRLEKVCCPNLNSGLFTAFKEQGDVLGMFVGHDHDNDYITEYQDILLGYGRYSGGGTVYNDLKTNGARVIELTSGSRTLKTWERLRTGEKFNDTDYPADFVKHGEPVLK